MDDRNAFEMGVLFGIIMQRLRDIEYLLADIPHEDRTMQVEICAEHTEYLLSLMADEYEKSEGA